MSAQAATTIQEYRLTGTSATLEQPTPRWRPLPLEEHAFTTRNDPVAVTNPEFARLIAVIDLVASDQVQWDDAEQPTLLSVVWAKLALDELALMDFVPTKILASAEGGIGICFVAGSRYADIEFLNSNDILAVTSNGGGDPRVWEVSRTVEGLIRALGTIRDYIRTA